MAARPAAGHRCRGRHSWPHTRWAHYPSSSSGHRVHVQPRGPIVGAQPNGPGPSVRVMLKRGRRDVGPPGFSSASRWRGGVNGALLLLSLLLLLRGFRRTRGRRRSGRPVDLGCGKPRGTGDGRGCGRRGRRRSRHGLRERRVDEVQRRVGGLVTSAHEHHRGDEDADDGDACCAGSHHRARGVVPWRGRLVAAELIDEFVLVESVVKVGPCHGNRY